MKNISFRGTSPCRVPLKKVHRLHKFTQIIKKNQCNQCNQCNLWTIFFHRLRARQQLYDGLSFKIITARLKKFQTLL
jgi:hypothetical protein